MIYDTYLGLHAPARAAQDAKARLRAKVLDELGLGDIVQDHEFDALAARTAAVFAAKHGLAGAGLYSMANLITDEQKFVGLYNPAGKRPVDRTMRRDQGWCPDVVDRGRALVLSDVFSSPRFAGNHVVGAAGIRTYAGAPVAHGPSGVVFGTVCVIGTEEMPEDTEEMSLALIKDSAAQLAALIEERTGQPITSEPNGE